MRDAPDLPAWLPPLVREHARLIYQQSRDDDDAAALLRVTIDPRMEAVWAYLRRRRRDVEDRHVRTHEYAHAARDDNPNDPNPDPRFPTRNEALQQHALRRLYGEVVRLTRLYGVPSRPKRRPPAHPLAPGVHPNMALPNRFEREAAAHRVTAERLASRPIMPARERRKVQKALQRAALSYDALAAAVVAETIDHLPVAVARGIARKLFQGFVGQRTTAAGGPIGDYMPTQAAIIASVIFGQTITASDVEYRLAVAVG
jgi:hypothetical protein